jgi:outer membrane protein TolC
MRDSITFRGEPKARPLTHEQGGLDPVKSNHRNSDRKTGWRLAACCLLGFGLLASRMTADDEILTLEQAVKMALAGNERAITADQNVEAASARVLKARAFFLPTINLSGTYTRRPFETVRVITGVPIIVQSLNALSGAASLSMTLFDSKSLPTLVQANSDRAAEEFATIDSKRKLAFEVGSAFLATLSIDQLMEASRRRYDFSKQSLEAARARYAAGLVSVNDVTRAELELANAEVGTTQVEGQVESAYLNLGYLINGPTPRKLRIPDFLLVAADEAPPALQKLVLEAQDRRPDVKSLRMRAKAQGSLAIEPLLRWLPTLTLNGRYTYTNEAGLTGRNFNWNAGLTMNWAVFDGLTRNGDYSERKALSYQADLNLKAALRKVDLDVRNAVVSLQSAQASLKRAAVADSVARRNVNETTELYRQGLSSALQVADAIVRQFEAEVALVQARYSLGIAYLNLEAALGLDPFGKEPNLES